MRLATPLLIAAASFAGAAAVTAQAPTPIQVGQSVTGSLSATGPRLGERGAVQVYRFRAGQGDRVIATMRSGSFDAFLMVARTVAGLTEYLKSDDDGGGGESGTDARLRFTAPEAGDYLLVAQALAEDGEGAFTLSLERAPEPTTARRGEIRAEQSVAGELAETDAVNDLDDTYYDEYALRAAPGERLSIEMSSTAFDAYLSVGSEQGGGFEAIATDDDGGAEGTDSRLTFTMPADGEILLRASSLGAATGAYTLRVTPRGPRRTEATPRPISIGQEMSGELTEDDAQLEDDSFFDYWSFTGRTGERVGIRMTSDAFDTFLAVGRLSGGAFEELATNDDDGESVNSLIEFTVPADGTYVVRTNSLTGETTGAYTLRVERLP